VTLNSGGTGNDWDGTLAIRDGATFSGAGTQTHTIGGSWIASSTATYIPSNTSVVFDATTAGYQVIMSGSDFYDVTFNGVGGEWEMIDSYATSTNDFTITAGSVVLPNNILTVGSSFDNTGGSFDNATGTLKMVATSGGKTLELNGSDLYNLEFNGIGGDWDMVDVNATTSNSVLINNGLPAKAEKEA